MSDLLFTATNLGAITIRNRIVMAPMTRSRAGEDGVPSDISATYYSQRSTAGMIITEGTHPSPDGKGYCRTPGIYTTEQMLAWTNIVNQTKGKNNTSMVLQIMHCGRIASVHNKDHGGESVAPSAIKAKGKMYTDSHGMVDFDTPRALSLDEISRVIGEYKQATENAIACGFDGVELHATSGYLPAQFLSTGTNHRNDQYGGSVKNRIRFVVEVLQAMSEVCGAERVGIRICPGNPFNDLHDDNPEETFTALLDAIEPMGLAYLHVIRMPSSPVDNIKLATDKFSGPKIFNDSYDQEQAEDALKSGGAHAVSFGRHYVANPDIVHKFKNGLELKKFDPKTLYTLGDKGYIDY